jgi:hypothetical protein
MPVTSSSASNVRTAQGPAKGSSAGSRTSEQDQKDWADFLRGVLPPVAGGLASALGIDPRVAGQTISQVLSIFGIGGGKAFSPAVPRSEIDAQLRAIVAPHLGDPVFTKALTLWLQAAVEPVQAQKDGKAYVPTVDLDKDWFSDAFDSISSTISDIGSTIGDVASGINWGQVAQVGMQTLPWLLSII